MFYISHAVFVGLFFEHSASLMSSLSLRTSSLSLGSGDHFMRNLYPKSSYPYRCTSDEYGYTFS